MLLSRYNPPKITARSALSYDLATNQFVYQKNIYEKLPIASLTKIMTALVAIENEDLGKRIIIDKKSAEIGEDSMGLSAGEILTLEDLLYGLMLHSGNDAAEAIARSSTFGRENFIYLMNKKAQDLGAINTNFTNPSGLEGDGDQHSTAYDLLIITRNALENKIFAKIVSTVEYKIPKIEEHKEYDLFNETNLLTSYPGVRGVKTGFTNEAGYCLVTYLEYGGHRIIAVLLDSKNRREEMKDLLDYSLRSFGVAPPKHK
jgi:D-alanyl-D-alanine carboxypeptidase (penicillin-binding protein 5/6)